MASLRFSQEVEGNLLLSYVTLLKLISAVTVSHVIHVRRLQRREKASVQPRCNGVVAVHDSAAKGAKGTFNLCVHRAIMLQLGVDVQTIKALFARRSQLPRWRKRKEKGRKEREKGGNTGIEKGAATFDVPWHRGAFPRVSPSRHGMKTNLSHFVKYVR